MKETAFHYPHQHTVDTPVYDILETVPKARKARYALYVMPEVQSFDWFSKFFPFLLHAGRLFVHLPSNIVIFCLLSTHL